jgi:hypothetical protein
VADRYYTPVTDVRSGRVGRRLNRFTFKNPTGSRTDLVKRPAKVARRGGFSNIEHGDYSDYLEQLRPGENLYLGLWGGYHTPRDVVVQVSNETDFERWMGHYVSGTFWELDIYAIRAGHTAASSEVAYRAVIEWTLDYQGPFSCYGEHDRYGLNST